MNPGDDSKSKRNHVVLPEEEENSDDEKGVLAALLAGLTKAFIYGLKSIPRTLVKASLHKQAFLTLGRRTENGGTYEYYRYDGKKVTRPTKLSMPLRSLGMC